MSSSFVVSSDPLLLPVVFYLSNLAAKLPLSIFYRYFHANCSSELANCMPLLLPRPRRTRLSSQAHFYTVQTPYARVNQYLHSFFRFTGRLWNSLTAGQNFILLQILHWARLQQLRFCRQVHQGFTTAVFRQ